MGGNMSYEEQKLKKTKTIVRPQSRLLVPTSRTQNFKLSPSFATPLYSFTKYAKVNAATPFSIGKNEEEETEDFEEYLAEDGEKYFACFFALPIVLSTMRWGIAAGRKTMVATTVLLFVLSGPVKAITYLVRAIGALGNVVIASYLIGENILALITINVHALVTFILSSMGIIAVPSMNFIYFIFGFLLLLNCGFFAFLLHLLYAVFFTRLGMKASLRLPKWLEAAI
ncbi:hypothetical protein DH2020_007012 [Rehmannia glutinosa]|uniref:Uncharacterized protein n=1 Tax=Rehmannia glutinosa TaxID=99300 RepID=A0ABR0TWN6_REHGL